MITPLIIFALFGLAYGIVLQRSGFCFARASFELSLSRAGEALDGLIAGLVMAILGFAAVAAVRAHVGLEPQAHLLILPFGVGTAIGAIIFGLGMSLAGMCAAGTLQRLGEGYVVAWCSLVGMIAGAALDPFRAFLPAKFKTPSAGVWLGNSLGAISAALLSIVVLMLIWLFITSVDNRKSTPTTPIWRRLRERSFYTPPVIGGIILGLLNTAQMAFAMPWTIGYPLALVSSAASGSLTHTAVSQAVPLLMLNAGIILGALIASAHNGRFRFRWPRRTRDAMKTLAGGILMGWGIQLAIGCSIGGVFSALPSQSLSGWIFLPSIFFGGWLGTWVVRKIA